MTFKYRYRKQILIGVIILIILGCGIGSYIYFREDKEEVIEEKSIVKKDGHLEWIFHFIRAVIH